MTAQQEDSYGRSVGGNLLQDSIEWIGENLDPADVFDEETLAAWATENGYVKAE